MKGHVERGVVSWSGVPSRRRSLAVGAGVPFVVGLFFGTVVLQQVVPGASSSQFLDSDRIYSLTNVWTVHLKFEPEQWEAMDPVGGGNPFFGGTPGGGPAGPGGVAVDRALAPVLMSQGDLDRNGRLAREEFDGLAEQWFKDWDATGAGKIDAAQIRAGLDAIPNPAGGGIAGLLLAAEGKRNGVAAALGIEFEYVHADLEFEGRWLRNVGVRYKGNGTFMESRGSSKRSLKIQLNRYAKGQALGNVRTLILQNNVTDGSLMNEVLAYRLYRGAGVPAPRTAYARVFVSVPGQYDREYLGLYSMSEAVDKQFAERQFGTKRGAIFKPVTPSLFTDLGADWAAYNQIYDPKVARFDQLVAGETLSTPGPFGGGQTKPIKPFSQVRTESVQDQLAGRSEGLVGGAGFGGGGGLGAMFSQSLVRVLNGDQDALVTRSEFAEGWARLFERWNTEGRGNLSWAELQAGIARDLPPQGRGFSPGGGGRGGPPGRGASPGADRGPGRIGGGGAPAAEIAGTQDPGLFVSEHWGMTAFSQAVPNGKYLAKLYFAETYAGITGPGQRVFSFDVPGGEFKDFDIWVKAGGLNRAYVETVPVEVTTGEFRIVFTRQIENPAIKAIEIIPLRSVRSIPHES